MLIDFTPEQRVLTVFIYLITLCLHKMSNRFRSQCFKNEKKWIVTTVFAPFKEKFKKIAFESCKAYLFEFNLNTSPY